MIPARLAATRLPNKPLADIHGEPMIVHVWRRAVEADLGPVLVAADDLAVVQAIKAVGGRVVMTRTDHASGSDRIFEALGAFDPEARHGIVVNLQGDLPTIDAAAMRAAVDALESLEREVLSLQRAAALPKPHRYRLQASLRR